MAKVVELLLSQNFKVLEMDTFDGSKDSIEYIEMYKAHVTLHGVPDEIACRAFLVTLK
jgi:uncharacterized Fe-S cluster-containing protein